MASVTWTTKRNPSSGHSIGVQYYLNFDLGIGSQKSYNSVRFINDSISGKREVIRHREDVIWLVVAANLPVDDLDVWEEFLTSVVSGESFTFDPYGTYASPSSSAATVLMNSNNWVESPQSAVNDYFDITFEVRVA